MSAVPQISWTYGGKRYVYPFSDSDIEWLARAIWREGRPREAVAFTLLQRFALLWSRTRPYKTFTDFVRAYSQPINPRWYPDGDKHKARVAQLRKAGNEKAAQDEINRAERRLTFASQPADKLSPYFEIVQKIISGKVQNPVPTAIHFRASQAASSDTAETAFTKAKNFAKASGLGSPVTVADGYGRGVNWFFAGKPPTLDFSALAVSATAIGFGLLLLAGLYFLTRPNEKSL